MWPRRQDASFHPSFNPWVSKWISRGLGNLLCLCYQCWLGVTSVCGGGHRGACRAVDPTPAGLLEPIVKFFRNSATPFITIQLLEIGHSGGIYANEILKCSKPGLFIPRGLVV